MQDPPPASSDVPFAPLHVSAAACLLEVSPRLPSSRHLPITPFFRLPLCLSNATAECCSILTPWKTSLCFAPFLRYQRIGGLILGNFPSCEDAPFPTELLFLLTPLPPWSSKSLTPRYNYPPYSRCTSLLWVSTRHLLFHFLLNFDPRIEFLYARTLLPAGLIFHLCLSRAL